MYVVVFDDEKTENFWPLTYTRATFDLRIGMYTLLQRAEKHLGRPSVVYVKDYLADVYRERLAGIDVNPEELTEDVILVNARALINETLASEVRKRAESKKPFVATRSRDVAIAYVPQSVAGKVAEVLRVRDFEKLASLLRAECGELVLDVKLLTYPWEIIHLNADVIRKDFAEFRGREWEGEVDPTVIVYGDKANVYVAKGARVEAYTVLDTRGGPIYIGENTRVAPAAMIEGPTYVGKDTLIVSHALIREGSNIGDVCRVGGEVEESIIHGYSNKYHVGFLGHAYVGEWVNLGALTTNSDLKDTYGTVKVTVKGRRVDTGFTKVGCFIGDMAKTSIGTYIYTGKKIGVASHLHGIVYEDVPSFTIYAKSLGVKPVELFLESAIEIQRRMMARRKKELTKAEEELIRRLYEITEEERRAAGVEKAKFKL